jgi:beta-alanine--pyruvate transaminase
MSNSTTLTRQELESFWMPFTANRQFKDNPRLLERAEGMYYWTTDGRKILDGFAGMWCVNAGHGRKEIADAVHKQLSTMEYAPPFQMGHPIAFEFANVLTKLTPGDLNHVFFTNSGSESVDTALKIAIAYQRLRGEASRQRLIGREKGYHGVGFGGISVGGMVNNRKYFGAMLPGVDHLRHTLDIARNAFSRGEPEHGVELAEDLERLVQLHDASTIAAVIVEPVIGSAGMIPPPKGYLKRIREICTKHGILMIMDEVITGFGRLGHPFAAQYFDVLPDMITCAKGITNGAVPMGAVFVRKGIYDMFMQQPDGIDLFHGYTYSGHPVACAAGLATQEIYRREGLLTRAQEIGKYFEDAVHSLKGLPNVIDIRNIGLTACVEFAPIPGKPGARGFDVFLKCFERGVLLRASGDIVPMSPPLIIDKQQIDQLIGTLAEEIKKA